jgi:quercetin dioxygenase-like cupin family protein
VTVSALIAAGQVAQIPFHLNRAMDNGLTKAQASEVLTHPGVLRRLAQRDVGRAGRQERLRQSARLAPSPVARNGVFSTQLNSPMSTATRIEIRQNGSRPSTKGPAQNFTGSVVSDPLFDATEHTHARGGLVTFEPGARTAWHTHPADQTLIVASGTGWVQEWGGERRRIQPGDVIWIPPDVKHWHGATATNRMSHIAITNVLDDKAVDWMEQVSDEEYGAASGGLTRI